MKIFQSLLQVLFQIETSLCAFFWKMICKNSVFLYVGLLFDFSGIFLSELMGGEYGFPAWTFLMWFTNYCITIVQFYRHFPDFYSKLMYYLLLIISISPLSSALLFLTGMVPFWLAPLLTKYMK